MTRHDAATTTAAPQPGTHQHSWATRLRAVGALLDRQQTVRLRDVCLLDVEGGFVVEALASPRAGDERTAFLLSDELTAQDLAAVMAETARGAPRDHNHGGRRRER